ncbi:VOC family protein [Paracoccus aminovorans]|uniref:VOC family protein n=1 Tax=Paracoccus aminovorans TaxID=34004 RepID=UPI002B260387|nr:VOC family protein [Paracoccus aminovorans]
MRYLHTMVRVADLEKAMQFWCGILGLRELRRRSSTEGRFTLVYLAAPADLEAARQNHAPILELTWNWDPETYGGGRNFGHLAFEVEDIYQTCARLAAAGVTINRPPRDGYMAFIRSPDGISVELLQAGDRRPPQEPWASLPNSGSW